jgi:integrase-like protein
VRRLTFHELRHTFGTIAGNAALSPRELQAWLGHADLKTTERYWHYRSRGDEAGRLDGAFAASGPQASEVLTADTAFRVDATADEETPALAGVSAEPGGTA